MSNRSINRFAPMIPSPRPDDDSYSPSRIAWRFGIPGPRSRIRITIAGAGPLSTMNSSRAPPAYLTAFRAISEVAVAILVWSSGAKPSNPAICRARCRASTMSTSRRISRFRSGRFMKVLSSLLLAAKTVTSSRPRL